MLPTIQRVALRLEQETHAPGFSDTKDPEPSGCQVGADDGHQAACHAPLQAGFCPDLAGTWAHRRAGAPQQLRLMTARVSSQRG